MPLWAKIVLGIVGLGFVLLVATGILIPKILQRTWESFETAMTEAGEQGTEFGASHSLDACLESGARRSGECQGMSLSCAPSVTAYLWGCLEAAPYDAEFCSNVPQANQDLAMERWARTRCRQYGQPDDEICMLTMAVVAGFCESQGSR
jgi:hypothetical protein